MEWARARLADLAADERWALNGGPFGSKLTRRDYTDSGVPVIRGGNLAGPGRFSQDGFVYVSEEKADELRPNNARPGDIIFTQRGTVGQVGLIPLDAPFPRFVISQSQMKLTPDATRADPRFLYYYFSAPATVKVLKGLAFSAGVPHINLEILRNFEVLLPPLSAQRSIGANLSTYDDLIENNLLRIQILEKMATLLYRDWFGRFSADSLPQGWEKSSLGEQLVGLEAGSRPSGGARLTDDGIPSIGAENVNGIGRHDFTVEKFVPRGFFEQMRRGMVRNRDVALYKDGAYIGRSSYFRDGFPHAECCVNEHVFLLRSNGTRLTQNALYLWLREPNTVRTIRAANANAAQPGINQVAVRGLELVVPDPNTAAKFDRLVEPMLAGIVHLAKINRKLSAARDLLLTRLLSGELHVGEDGG